MIVGSYRILEREYASGDVKYVLEMYKSDGAWHSVYAHPDLNVIREAKAKRETEQAVVKEKVVE